MSGEAQPIIQRMTLEEFWQLPEGPPHYEFEEGEVILMPSPHSKHQEVLIEVAYTLKTHVRIHRLGRVWIGIDVEFVTLDKVYVPDIVYLSTEHLNRHDEEDGKIHGAPDLAVEIVSKYGAGRDRVVKFNTYFTAGVPWYWIIEPDSLIIEEYHAEEKGYMRTVSVTEGDIFRSQAMPGLEFNLRELLVGVEDEEQ
ncbi:MAG: Uma2 family endonuclease [Deltaproteobacteria bacterium]|nr:Uma2 family endonuclease [Deltaproteobacteria bacterium]